MKKQKQQLHEIFTIGIFYLMLISTVLLITSNLNQVSIQDSIDTSSSEVSNY